MLILVKRAEHLQQCLLYNMASIKYSGLVQNVKGSLNGTVLQGNGSNTIVRTKPSATVSNSSYSQVSKSILRKIAVSWKNITQAQRAEWAAYALSQSITNKFGDKVKISGYQAFMSANTFLASSNNTVLVSPPVAQSITDIGEISVDGTDLTDIKLNWQYFTGTNEQIQIYASIVGSMGKGFRRSEMKEIMFFDASGDLNTFINVEYDQRFPYQPTSGRIYVMTRVVNIVTGQYGKERVTSFDYQPQNNVYAQAYFNKVVALGYPALSLPLQTIYNNLYLSLLSGTNNYGKLKKLWVFGCEDVRQSYVNLVAPNDALLSPKNGIETTFVAYRGMFPNGTNQWIDCQYNPTVDTGTYTLNSAGMSVYSRTNSNNNKIDLSCVNGAVQAWIDLREGGQSYMAMNDGFNGLSMYTPADSLGCYTFLRTSSTSIRAYKRGVIGSTRTYSSTSLPNSTLSISCYNDNGTRSAFSARNLLVVAIHSGALDAAEFNTSIEAFATAIGANV